MKYNIGHSRAMPVYANIESFKFGKLSLKAKNNCTDTITLSATTIIKCLGYRLFKAYPCLLINILSSVYVTLLALASKYGVKVKVKTSNKADRVSEKSLNKSTTEALRTIPIQNIKFQKLSLFMRDLMKFMQLLLLTLNILILPCFKAFLKEIKAILLLFTIMTSPFTSFADNLQQLINETEQNYAIPRGLLSAIASVESGLKPYAINISGKSVVAKSKAEAVEIVRLYQDNGVTNIDLGIAQINLHFHGKHFSSVSEMLDPKHNIEYAAQFLSKLYKQYGSWNKAVRHYHSANPEHHRKYSRKVLVSWLDTKA